MKTRMLYIILAVMAGMMVGLVCYQADQNKALAQIGEQEEKNYTLLSGEIADLRGEIADLRGRLEERNPGKSKKSKKLLTDKLGEELRRARKLDDLRLKAAEEQYKKDAARK